MTEIVRKLNPQLMNGNDYRLLLALFQTYSSLEKEIQKRTNQTSNHFCSRCLSRCCKEEICRESVESIIPQTLSSDGFEHDSDPHHKTYCKENEPYQFLCLGHHFLLNLTMLINSLCHSIIPWRCGIRFSPEPLLIIPSLTL